MFADLPIRFKFLLLYTLLLAALTIFISLYFPRNFERQARAAIVNKANSIAQITALSIGPALLFDDRQSCEEALKAPRELEDLVYIMVQDSAGVVFASFNDSAANAAAYFDAARNKGFTEEHALYKVAAPITARAARLGTLYAGFSLESMNGDVFQIRRTMFLISLAIFLLGIAAVFAISTLITRPLSSMVRTVEKIGQGDLMERAVVASHDEIGQLAIAFNAMVVNLEKANHALRESEKKWLFVESAPDIVCTLDEAGTVLFINHSFGNATRENIIGTKIIGYWKETDQRMLVDALLFVFREKIPVNIEIQSSESYGEHQWYSCRLGPIKEGERVVSAVMIAANINDRKKTEEERGQLENQLRQSQKMEAIGQLAGGIAHDFNNMLAGISGFGDLLRTKFGKENPIVEKYANSIVSTAGRASDLTSKLLAFSRKGKFELVLLDVHETITEVVKILERTIEKNITITQKFRARPSTLLGDPSQVQNAILNLAVNARDAMPKGGELNIATDVITIDERFIAQRAYKINLGKYIRISISDTGMGMNEEVKARLFEPFFTTKAVGKGTGLGLASVYGTAKSHDGFVDVFSEIGKGSTFSVFLPLTESQVSRNETLDASIETGTGHILVVDDEDVVREMLSEILKELGYEVSTAANGEEAVVLYREQGVNIDLVILDVIMPKMGGPECLKELRKINPNVKAVISSGYALDAQTQELSAEGISGYLQKPFTIVRISQVILEALRKQEL
ncbi:MAG: hypothetical protein A2350_14715 [Candidatus Raymondbacteria bacterium RifOxyB12_full_50_8]|nr:MAG: hypothetical protein A2350_14715 [Candidatus Raymondbacteria bacterium RifOxyB12_full_50_8]